MAQTRSRLERLPERPGPDAEQTRRRLADVRRNVEVADPAAAVRQINHRDTQIPWEEVEETSGPQISFNTVQNAALFKKLGLYVRLMRGSNNSHGAHFHAEQLGRLSDYQKADVIEQLERLDQRNMTWRTKLVASLLKSHAEFELFKKGYVRKEGAGPATESHQVTAGQTLETIMASRNAGERWREIKDGKVVGPLDTDGPLPEGSHVYFNADGYPVFLSMQAGERPAVPIFEKKDDVANVRAPAGWKWGAEAYKRYEFMQRRLKLGDVMFSNARRDLRSGPMRLFYARGRMLQGQTETDESFPYIHAMVMVGRDPKGQPIMAHLDGKKKSIRPLYELVNADSLDSFSVGRARDQATVQNFVKRATEIASSTPYASTKEVLEYDRLLAKRRSGATLTQQDEKRLNEICVCTNAVTRAGRDAGVDELKTALTALDMFNNFEITDSVNIQTLGRRGGRRKRVRLQQPAARREAEARPETQQAA